MNNCSSVQIFDLFYFGVTSFFGEKFQVKKPPLKTRPKNAPISKLFPGKINYAAAPYFLNA